MGDAPPQPYRYHPLKGSGDFRLLQLHKDRNHRKTPTTAIDTRPSIVHVRVEDPPRYETVSYVWGHPRLSHRIELADGDTLAVTSSLYRALPHLMKASRTGYLWIDQITIDQANIAERSDQVRMMGEIYLRCVRCLIWIDSDRSIAPASGTKLAWASGSGAAVRRYLQLFRGDDVQQLLHNMPREQMLAFSSPSATPILATTPAISTPSAIPKPDSIVRDHLLWFLEHPWFSRTWVFQEFVLPGEKTFLIGDFEIPGEELESVFTLGFPRSTAWFDTFHQTFNIAIRRAANFDEAPGLEFLLAACTIRGRFRGSEEDQQRGESFITVKRDTFFHYEPCTFLDMVYAMAECQASDPRDHVYAFVGFAPFLLRHMTIDYSMAVEKAFATMLKAFLKESRSLDFFAHLPSEAGISRSTLNLPSWVPNWTTKDRVHPILCQDNLFCASGKGYGLPGARSCRHYEPEASFWKSLEWNELRVAGKIIDTVEYRLKKISVYQILPMTSIDVHQCTGRLPWEMPTLDALLANLAELGCTCVDELPRDGLLRALFMDGVQWAALDALASEEDLYRTDMRIFDHPHGEKMRHVIDVLLGPPPVDWEHLPHSASPQLLHELSKIQYGRRIILTTERRFGLAPDLVERGDKIALLHGCRSSVILRPRPDGRYAAVGECYYDGAMYGELADMTDDHADTFVLV